MSEVPTNTGDDEQARLPAGANVILCADDFAISDGVSKGIEELALARRLSATSAIVTLSTWPQHAPRLAALRGFVAIGMHLNLTLGAPLGAMPGLAPDGELPSNATLVRKSLLGGLRDAEIGEELERQLLRFEELAGCAPDFIDGHQHVHVLPGIRRVLLDVARARYGSDKPLIRDPGERPAVILRRQTAAHKALAINALSRGFGTKARAAGFPTNHGFAGVSAFDLDSPFEEELLSFFAVPGPRHLVMCHPGYPDAALAELDGVVERRHHELDALFAMPHLEEAIWHVRGGRDRAAVRWEEALPA